MNTTLAEINERLAELETRFAFQDDVVASLNPQVATHERRLIDFADELRQLQTLVNNELRKLEAP